VRAARYARIFFRLQLVRLRVQMEYEADFWLGVAGVFLTQLASFTFVWAVFLQAPRLAGWTLWEAAILYALLIIPRGLVDLLCDGAWHTPWQVNTGSFDRLLLRPVPVALQVFSLSSRIHGLGHLILGIALMVTASLHLELSWTPLRVLLLLGVLVNALLILGSVNLVANSSAFWERSGNNSFAIFVGSLADAVQVPLAVYGPFARLLLTWVLPFAFVSYYPTCLLLGKPVEPSWILWLIPLSGPIVALAASVLWRLGLTRYESTGH
jgi:ABC-2 type transport system permease protein